MIWKISLFFLILPSWVLAVSCGDIEFDGKPYSICQVNLDKDELRLFLNDAQGLPFGHFSNLPVDVEFAMNAGMYHNDRRPVGHYVEDEKTVQGIITSAGPGNFGMVPNGVLCIRNDRTDVYETLIFVQERPKCLHATQSGPMLVINGQLHPRFIRGSSFLNIRNGVGTTRDGKQAFFVISNRPVNFHEFARLFRDQLGVDQALYFDGRISRLYSKELKRSDFGTRMGPIIAVPSK